LPEQLSILALGKNPITAFYSLLQGSGILPKPVYAAKKGSLPIS